MVGLAFASVPLYRAFCEATGFDGTPLRADKAPGAVAGQISVRFDANVHPGLPWRFEPVQNTVQHRAGRADADLLSRAEPHRAADHRPGGVQRDPRHGRQIFQEDPMLLLHRADAEAGRDRRHAGGVLRRSRDPEGPGHQGHPRDHLELHILPGGNRRPRPARAAAKANEGSFDEWPRPRTTIIIWSIPIPGRSSARSAAACCSAAR